ncbi:unnamed protein product, partial [Closterium sp. Naga37s-1]
MIRAIDKAAIHRICSGQVVLDVAAAVKELVENSLDAGATSVEVRLKDFGAELIEVADNGCGVAPPNWQLAGGGLESEGDGGESLKAVGTTVSMAKIFSPLPVRRREFERNVRREFAKLVSALQAYCVVSTHARILCTNQSGRSSARTTVVQTAGTGSMRENIIAVFGAKAAGGLDPVDITFPLSPSSAAAAAPAAPALPSAATSAAATAPAPLPASCCRVTGFLSRPGAGSGRSAGDRQFFFLNGRPVDLPRLSKLLNELYRSFNSLQFPAAFLNVSLSADAYDVNVTPDKRKVFLHSEAALLSGLRAALSEYYSPDRCGGDELNGGGQMEEDEEGVEVVEGEGDREQLRHQCERGEGRVDAAQGGPVGKDVTCGDGTADRSSLSRGYETRHKAAAERQRDWQRVQQVEEEEAEEEEEEEEPEQEEEEEERESEGANVGRRDGSSRAVRGGGQRSMRGVAAQAQGVGSRGVGRGRAGVESSGGVERARGGADGRQAGLDAWLGKRGGGGRGKGGSGGGKMAGVDVGGRVRGRAGYGSAEDCGKGKAVERDEDQSEEDEDTDEVREVEQVEGEGGEMPVERGRSHDGERHDAAQCGVHGGLQEATRDEWAGKSVLELPLMTQEITQADLPELVGSQLLPGTQLAGQHETSEMAVAEGAGKGRCCGGHAGELEGEEGQEGGERGVRIEGMETEEGAALGANRVAGSGEGWEVRGAEGSVQVQFNMRRVQQVWRRRAEREAREKREGRRGVAGHGKSERQRSFAAASVADGTSNAAHSSGGRKIQHEGEGKEAALEAAARELERRFDKRDFASMAVIGQFNLGFIIGRLGSDLFIVDQHASDEKFNFERLMRCTLLNRQPLLVPQRLDFSPTEEVIVSAHMPTFRSNGFHFSVDESAPSGRRFCLSAVPFSKNIVFGASDVCELISMLADAPLPDPETPAGSASLPDAVLFHATGAAKDGTDGAPGAENHQGSLHENSTSSPQVRRSEINNESGTVGGPSPRKGRSGAAEAPAPSPSASPSTIVAVRPSRVRAMLASRACRSSVMIGTALSQAQMSK